MNPSFRSNDFHFIPNAMSAAFIAAGSSAPVTFRREPKILTVNKDGYKNVVRQRLILRGRLFV